MLAKILWTIGIILSGAVIMQSAEWQPIQFESWNHWNIIVEGVRMQFALAYTLWQAGGNTVDRFAIQMAQVNHLSRLAS